ncbi:MAG TPA: DinB family protein [Candidatus Eisenbacteria bacterium]|nr:DinB family protein [Candidatus Eisenbacteria bacterium]
MTQQTMSDIDAFKNQFEKEYQTTRRLLHAYPASKGDLRPSEKLKTAQELAWMLALNQMVLVPALEMAELTGAGLPGPPATWADVLATFDKAHKDTTGRLNRVTDAEWSSELSIPVGPNQMGSMQRGQAMWFFLSDTIHHRGQFSVYARMAGAKVPSIYGPSADEPWR